MISVSKIEKTNWEKFSKDAHYSVFEEDLPDGFDRIDYALIAEESDTHTPLAYLTAREHDAETIYLKHGGAFPPAKDTALSFFSYKKMLLHLMQHYKYIQTYVKNTNVVYLKFALTMGLRITGLRVHKEVTYLELTWSKEV